MINNQVKELGFGVVGVVLVIMICGLAGFTGFKLGEASHPKSSPIQPAPVTNKLSDDQRIEQAAKTFCEAQLGVSGVHYVFSLGTAGPDHRKFLYSSDKQFASINVRCDPGTSDGGGTGYILKKVNDTWLVVMHGTMEDPETAKLFGVPKDFE